MMTKEKIESDNYATDPIIVNNLLVVLPEIRKCKKALEPCAGGGFISDRLF